jgi:hypothetical protein
MPSILANNNEFNAAERRGAGVPGSAGWNRARLLSVAHGIDDWLPPHTGENVFAEVFTDPSHGYQ